MKQATYIRNTDDIIDSRDVIARIAELEKERGRDAESDAELEALKSLAEFGKICSGDWDSGATLIRDSYFIEYAQELAEDIGAISDDARWPLSHIDWDAAAEMLKTDYTLIEFEGVTYWIR